MGALPRQALPASRSDRSRIASASRSRGASPVGTAAPLADNPGRKAARMARVLASRSLRDYFLRCLHRSFGDLAVAEEGAAPYLSDLLSRYALRPDFGLPGIADRLAEIHRAWQLEGPEFDPGREVVLRREIGDYTLFMTGFLWERVEAMAAQHHYTRLGSSAYRFVAEHHRAQGRTDAPVYRALADGFMRYAVVLMYLREVYADVEPARRPRSAAGEGE
jgi:hypothetical protein